MDRTGWQDGRSWSSGGAPSLYSPRSCAALALAVLVLLLALLAPPAGALDQEAQARIAEADTGPSTIDVSKYPAALQKSYEIFADKCSECHSLSRPINSEYALPDEWQRYVKRMMRKPDSGISSSEAKTIYEFLVYDAKERRAALVEKKLAELDDGDRREAQEKLDNIRQTYGGAAD